MIWLVAKPLLESGPDYKSKEMILNLATLAWNFTLLDPIEQGKMLVEIADLFQYPEGMEMFYYLADRKALLHTEKPLDQTEDINCSKFVDTKVFELVQPWFSRR